MMELCGVAALPFAVGAYLPISTSVPIMVGGFIRLIIDRMRKGPQTKEDAEFAPGVLLSSGLIAGGSLAGVLVAGLAGADMDRFIDLSKYVGVLAENDGFALIPFAILAIVLWQVGRKRPDVA